MGQDFLLYQCSQRTRSIHREVPNEPCEIREWSIGAVADKRSGLFLFQIFHTPLRCRITAQWRRMAVRCAFRRFLAEAASQIRLKEGKKNRPLMKARLVWRIVRLRLVGKFVLA